MLQFWEFTKCFELQGFETEDIVRVSNIIRGQRGLFLLLETLSGNKSGKFPTKKGQKRESYRKFSNLRQLTRFGYRSRTMFMWSQITWRNTKRPGQINSTTVYKVSCDVGTGVPGSPVSNTTVSERCCISLPPSNGLLTWRSNQIQWTQKTMRWTKEAVVM